VRSQHLVRTHLAHLVRAEIATGDELEPQRVDRVIVGKVGRCCRGGLGLIRGVGDSHRHAVPTQRKGIGRVRVDDAGNLAQHGKVRIGERSELFRRLLLRPLVLDANDGRFIDAGRTRGMLNALPMNIALQTIASVRAICNAISIVPALCRLSATTTGLICMIMVIPLIRFQLPGRLHMSRAPGGIEGGNDGCDDGDQ
jgi:hypothetical protein